MRIKASRARRVAALAWAALLLLAASGCRTGAPVPQTGGPNLLARLLGYEPARGGVLLAQLGKRASPPSPEAQQNVPAFSYDSYCDAQGRFTYDGAALALLRQPEHLRQAYSDADRSQPRAKELIRGLEQVFRDFGTWAADQTTHPRCLPLRELTPGCQPNWKILDDLLGRTAESARLRRVVADAYEVRARQRGAENAVILEAVNLLMAAGLAKGVISKAVAMELQAPAEAAVEGAAAEGAAAKRYQGGPGAMWANEARRPWKLTKEGADKIMRHEKFGKFYRSKPDAKLERYWWVEDRAQHGGSKFKMYTESSDGLHWYKDADEFGEFIEEKHKGDVGRFIPWSELSGVP